MKDSTDLRFRMFSVHLLREAQIQWRGGICFSACLALVLGGLPRKAICIFGGVYIARMP